MSAVLSTRTSAFITLLSVMLALWLWLQFGDRSMPVRSRIDNVLTPEVPPGGRLLLSTSVIREDRCPSEVAEFLFDRNGVRWLLETQRYPSPPGNLGHETFITPVHIPKDFPEGPATFRRIVSFVCNFTQS